MNKALSNFLLVVFISLFFINCANRGTPGGGPKDEDPPVIIGSKPENYSTNFNGKEIEIYFDEYIKIKDINKQLIISPPMKTQPEITPLGGASKYITIKIHDTLQPNTTYAFNFGNSITDNNEGNPYPYYRYVFATGDYIDSLSVKGTIVDALYKSPETFVSVALYEVDSTFQDSIIYKETPRYITNTLDSVTTFSIDNIKEGKYMLIAMKDGNGDNKFQQKTDQIGFYKDFIDVPTDTLYTLKLFSEELDFNSTRPKLLSGEKIAFGYEGDATGMAIDILSETPPEFEHRITKDVATDSLLYWYKPRLEVDSLIFQVTHPSLELEKEHTVRITKQERDSLYLEAEPNGNIGFNEPFKIFGNTPLVSIDTTKIRLIDQDSTQIDFTTKFDSLSNTYAFNFDKVEDRAYNIQLLPEAIKDFFDDTNDTLSYTLKTRKESDFGNIRFTLNNAKYPVIVQLTNDKGEIKYEQYSTKKETLDFSNLDSGKYSIRVIFDENGNGKYDPGSYLKKRQPERVIHFEMDDEVRPDWGHIQTLNFIDEE